MSSKDPVGSRAGPLTSWAERLVRRNRCSLPERGQPQRSDLFVDLAASMVGETRTQQVNSPAGSSLAAYTQSFPNVETSDSVIPFLPCPQTGILLGLYTACYHIELEMAQMFH